MSTPLNKYQSSSMAREKGLRSSVISLWRVALLHMIVLLLSGTGTVLPSQAQQGLALDPAKTLTQYQLDSWSTDDGLPQGTITSLLQTQDGYLWMGTQEGLVRFDGIRFMVFNKGHGDLENNYVSALCEDGEGRLWIGTRGGGLTRYQDGAFTTLTMEDGLPSNNISSLSEDEFGNIWIGTYDAGLARYNNPAAQKIDITRIDELGEYGINTLYESPDGTLWVGTRRYGLVRINASGLTAFGIADGLPDVDITSVTHTPDGRLWAGTREAGLAYLDGERFVQQAESKTQSYTNIETLYTDSRGQLWIGGSRAGVCRFEAQGFACLTLQEGLSSNAVKVLLQDREGSLWIGTDGGGLNRLRDGKFISYTSAEGLTDDLANTVFEDTKGNLWIGTDNGLNRLHDGQITTYTTAEGLPHEVVYSLQGTPEGDLWVGTVAGLSRFDGERFMTYTVDDGVPDSPAYSLHLDPAGTLWSGMHGLVRIRDGQFTTYTTEDGLSSNLVTVVADGPDGTLWVGTYDGGLNQFKEGRVIRTYSMEDGLGSNYVMALHPEPDGTLWLSTREGGLSRLRHGQVTTFSTRDGLLNDNIAQILEDGQGQFWMSSNQGLFVLSRHDLERYARGQLDLLAPTIYNKADGLKTQEFTGGTQPAGWKSQDGYLWFPTTGAGIVGIHPDQIQRNELPPLVVLERAAADETLLSQQRTISLSPGHNKFLFEYTGMGLRAARQVRFKYMLEGYDEDWIDAGNKREATYTNLDPGTYTFRVVARNNDGIWSSQAASTSFYLQPYFYETPFFFFLCILGFVLTGFVGYRLRVRHLKQREQELVQLVEHRTADLLAEKEKTEQALAVVAEQADKLQEMDRIKTRFFNNISHELRTPLTLNIGPLESALMNAYGPITDELRQRIEVMLRNSRLLLRLINQLLDVSKLEAGRMRLSLQCVNLVDFLEGIMLSFTPFAEQKQLTLEFERHTAETLMMNFDTRHLEKVFFNLLSNAVKFTPGGGHIRVIMEQSEDDATDKTVVLRVKDTGVGIPEKDLPHIFDRFHQVDGTVSNIQEGTGIGLALVKELVELHGGTIDVESQLGQGSEFIIRLPVSTDSLATIALEGDGSNEEPLLPISTGAMVEMAVFEDEDTLGATNGHDAVDTPTILVVDDNPEIRDYIARCLNASYHIRQAVDGQDALAQVRDQQPDLILTDVVMPNMTGYDLTCAVKEDAGLSHIPIIMLTSRASLDEKIKGLQAGADDYLTKPFSNRELVVRVRNLLRVSEQQQQLMVLNDELQHTNDELRDVGQMKSQLLRIVAHDLKNPLNGIREISNVLRMESESDSSATEFLNLIYTASDQMLSMVSKILDSEALDSGEFVMDKETVNVCEIARTVVRSNSPQANRKAITVHVDYHDDTLCHAIASKEWLQDAFDNLVSNAIKYSPFEKNIWISVERQGEYVRFVVRDEGPGLNQDDKEKLFGKFQRLSALPTSDESSTGLGLSIVKQIVELHDGRVWAESEYGNGSTFIIEIAGVAVSEPAAC